MKSGEIPNAIRCMHSFAGCGDAQSRLLSLQDQFSGILGSPRVYVRQQGTEHFLSADPSDSLLYSNNSPRSGTSRYHWQDRGDGVLYGFLEEGTDAPRG